MDAEQFDFLETLVETPSPAGSEDDVAKVWRDRMEPNADRVRTDAYGNTVVTVNPGADATVGVFVHLDEVGYMVRHISEDGFIYVQRLGGVDPDLARGQRVKIHGRDGAVSGVFGGKSFHLVVKDEVRDTPKIEDVWIDIGADDRESVEEAGVHVGAPVTHDAGLERLQDGSVVGRALDNMSGAWVVGEAIRQLDTESLDVTVHAVATVQEEIQHAGMKFFDEDLELDSSLVVDVTFATGTPPIEDREHGRIRLGEGPVCRHGRENHPNVVERIERVARSRDVPLQHEPVDTKGGERRTVYETTDAAYLANETGSPTGFVGIPCRYIHAPGEIVDLVDVERTVELVDGFVESAEP